MKHASMNATIFAMWHSKDTEGLQNDPNVCPNGVSFKKCHKLALGPA